MNLWRNLVRHNLYSHVSVDKTSPAWCEVVVVSLKGERSRSGLTGKPSASVLLSFHHLNCEDDINWKCQQCKIYRLSHILGLKLVVKLCRGNRGFKSFKIFAVFSIYKIFQVLRLMLQQNQFYLHYEYCFSWNDS